MASTFLRPWRLPKFPALKTRNPWDYFLQLLYEWKHLENACRRLLNLVMPEDATIYIFGGGGGLRTHTVQGDTFKTNQRIQPAEAVQMLIWRETPMLSKKYQEEMFEKFYTYDGKHEEDSSFFVRDPSRGVVTFTGEKTIMEYSLPPEFQQAYSEVTHWEENSPEFAAPTYTILSRLWIITKLLPAPKRKANPTHAMDPRTEIARSYLVTGNYSAHPIFGKHLDIWIWSKKNMKKNDPEGWIASFLLSWMLLDAYHSGVRRVILSVADWPATDPTDIEDPDEREEWIEVTTEYYNAAQSTQARYRQLGFQPISRLQTFLRTPDGQKGAPNGPSYLIMGLELTELYIAHRCARFAKLLRK